MFKSIYMSCPNVAGTHFGNIANPTTGLVSLKLAQDIVDQQIDEACDYHAFVRDREWRDEMELEAVSAEYEEERAQFEAEMKAQFPDEYGAYPMIWMEDEDAVCCTDESCAGCQGFISDEDDLPTESANYDFDTDEEYNCYLAELAAEDEDEPPEVTDALAGLRRTLRRSNQ